MDSILTILMDRSAAPSPNKSAAVEGVNICELPRCWGLAAGATAPGRSELSRLDGNSPLESPPRDELMVRLGRVVEGWEMLVLLGATAWAIRALSTSIGWLAAVAADLLLLFTAGSSIIVAGLLDLVETGVVEAGVAGIRHEATWVAAGGSL